MKLYTISMVAKDNNDISNLMLFQSSGDHIAHHWKHDPYFGIKGVISQNNAAFFNITI